ncbi:MAG: sigma-70 family RNA polymerase sigma factor [Acidimicrobiales bacterium]|nr:sigma-70 family RNA polymerase sigma factor [Acidimicrobiales bacterium]
MATYDDATFSAAKNGDAEAWRVIAEEYSPIVWSVLRSLGVREPDRSDIYQAVFLKLVQHLGTLREPRALPGWLVTVTRRECIDLFRRQERQPTPSEVVEDAVAEQPEPSDIVVGGDARRAVLDGFRKLTEQCQRLLSLLMGPDEISYADASALLGIPVGSIGPQRQRCLERLAATREVAALGPDWGSS